MKVIDFIKEFKFISIERPGTLASNSELRRWLLQKSIIINKEYPEWDDYVCTYGKITSFILFPKSINKRTVLQCTDEDWNYLKENKMLKLKDKENINE